MVAGNSELDGLSRAQTQECAKESYPWILALLLLSDRRARRDRTVSGCVCTRWILGCGLVPPLGGLLAVGYAFGMRREMCSGLQQQQASFCEPCNQSTWAMDNHFAVACQHCSCWVRTCTGLEGDPSGHRVPTAEDGPFWSEHSGGSREAETAI